MGVVFRYDNGRLGQAKKTPSGGLRLPGFIGRTGIQIYTNADGSIRREYRAPDEVFSADSLSSLGGAVVTRLHPEGGRVTPENWRAVTIGNVTDAPPTKANTASGDFIEAALLINDGSVIKEIESGAIAEISAGYTVDVELTPGISPNGEHYDAVQRNVRYNHVAVGPTGWARAGREARLRTDGTEEIPRIEMAEPIVKLVVDGVEYEKGSDSHISALQKKIDALSGEVTQVKTDSATALGKVKADTDTALATATARADKAEKALKDLQDTHNDAAFETRMSGELAFRADAGKYLGKDYVFTGKKRRDVQIDILKKIDPKVEFKADESDAYVAAYYAGRVASAPKPHDYNDGKEKDVPVVLSQAELNKRLDSQFVPADGVKK